VSGDIRISIATAFDSESEHNSKSSLFIAASGDAQGIMQERLNAALINLPTLLPQKSRPCRKRLAAYTIHTTTVASGSWPKTAFVNMLFCVKFDDEIVHISEMQTAAIRSEDA
jgi:hypothetical protein